MSVKLRGQQINKQLVNVTNNEPVMSLHPEKQMIRNNV